MSLQIKHKFVSSKTDSSDISLVNPSNWNDDHIITSAGKIEYTGDHDFASIAPVESLSSSLRTITLPVVPKGINATDTNHYLSLCDLNGTFLESVLINGGSAVSEGVNQTLTFASISSNYTAGSYVVRSGSSGFKEAIVACGTFGRVILSDLYLYLYGPVSVPGDAKISIRGIGQGLTVLRTMDATLSFNWIELLAGSQSVVDIGDFSIINNTNTMHSAGCMLKISGKSIGLINNIEIENGYDGLVLDSCPGTFSADSLHVSCVRRSIWVTTHGVDYPSVAQSGGSFSKLRLFNTVDACLHIEGPTTSMDFSNVYTFSYPPLSTNYGLQIIISDANPGGEITFNNCVFDASGTAIRLMGNGPINYTENWIIFNGCEANATENAFYINGLIQNVYWNGGLIKASGGSANQPINLLGSSPSTGPKNIHIKNASIYGDGTWAIAALNVTDLMLNNLTVASEGGNCKTFLLVQGVTTGFIQNCDMSKCTTNRIIEAGGASFGGLRVVDYSNAFNFSDLGNFADGSVVFCKNGTVANPVAGSGTGCLAKRINGAWVGN